MMVIGGLGNRKKEFFILIFHDVRGVEAMVNYACRLSGCTEATDTAGSHPSNNMKEMHVDVGILVAKSSTNILYIT